MAGELLAKTRRELNISLDDISKELNLDIGKVIALEKNDFDSLGAPVFAKGHLKKYAKFVKADEAQLIADYCQLNQDNEIQPFIAPKKRVYQGTSFIPLYIGIAVIFVLTLMYLFFSNRSTDSEQPVIKEIKPLSNFEELNTKIIPNIEILEEKDETIENNQEILIFPEQVPEIEKVIEIPETQLSIIYTGDCWTEVLDTDGNRLFFDLARSGNIVELSGNAPFNILFGDAANAALSVNGKPFDISELDRRGRTARLTILGP
jgi:cytoskeleton protein RodZ